MNNLTKKEILNYLRMSMRKPSSLLCAVKSFVKNRKYFGRRLARLPDLQACKPSYLNGIEEAPGFSETETAPVIAKGCQRFSPIILATGEFPIEDTISWEYEFKDTEDHEALHRWTWLLYKIVDDKSKETIAWVKKCMEEWITRYGFHPDSSLKWNAYAVSERVCNAIVICQKTGLDCQGIIADGLRVMAYHIAHHLEYYGSKDTFNHILNNARALYVYGVFFKDEELKGLAVSIFENELPRLITKEGFLREGSSHYHFLITRWILEVMFFASKDGDVSFIEKFKDYVKQMVRQCHFFLVHDEKGEKLSIPIIGDVSPDVTPQWLINLPASRLAKSFYNSSEEGGEIEGWAKLFNEPLAGVDSLDCSKEERHLINKTSGWYRFCCGETDLFIYLRPSANYSNRGHYHSDSLSFCLFIKGKPILIDCGRATYTNNDLGRWGQSADAHNSIAIDELELFPFLQSSYLWETFPKEMLRCVLSFEESDNDVVISLEGGGFRRLGKDAVDLTRTIRISKNKNSVEIQDKISGQKQHHIKTSFHCSPGFLIGAEGQNKFFIEGNGETIDFEATHLQGRIVSGESDSFEGRASLEYGRTKEISSMIFEATNQLPVTQTFSIHWR